MKAVSKILEESGIALLELEGRFDAYEEPQVRKWLDAQPDPGANCCSGPCASPCG
jgi:hypothetical protein